jgi:hypothetical protein
VGLGAALAAATIYSWVRIKQINDSDDYLAYRGQFRPAGAPDGISDACAAAADGKLTRRDPSKADLERSARSLCDEADVLQKLQYAFLGGAVVGAGVGTYLLVTSRDHTPASVSIAPRFGTGTALVEASFRF